MKVLFAAALFAAISMGVFAQTPTIRTINGVLSAASFAQQGMPNAGIAQGGMFTVFGTDLGPAVIQEVQAYPVSTTLAETSVTITSGATVLQAPMIFTLAGQVAAVMPSITPIGPATLTVTYKGVTSAPYAIQVIANGFGFFTLNAQGTGAGAITGADFKKFLPNHAAMPGDPVILWGTGLGALPYPDGDVPVATNLTNIPVELYVGDKLVSTGYQGPGCCSGINQIVFTVPQDVATGCNVPVEVKINNNVSPTATMPITTNPNRICSDDNGIPSSIWTTIFSKASTNVGFVSLNRATESVPILGSISTDTGSADFFNVEPITFTSTPALQVPAIGSCVVNVISEGDVPSFPGLTGLNAGPFVNATGPNGLRQMSPGSVAGTYSTAVGASAFLVPGAFTIANGAGGSDVGAFSFSLNVAPPLTWTNEAAITSVDRSAGVTVTWTGGAPGSYAKVTGFSSLLGPPAVLAEFICEAPVAQGSLTVPPNVLLQLPASTLVDGFGTGLLEVGNTSAPVAFTAMGLDYGIATSTVINASSVAYK